MAFKTAESKLSKYSDLETWNKKGELTEGSQLEGYYVDKEEFTTKFGEMIIFVIEKLDGSKIKVTGQSDIKNKFSDIELGVRVRLTFKGLVETKNGAMKGYEVEYDEEDRKKI